MFLQWALDVASLLVSQYGALPGIVYGVSWHSDFCDFVMQ
jgi:hypothetical protein